MKRLLILSLIIFSSTRTVPSTTLYSEDTYLNSMEDYYQQNLIAQYRGQFTNFLTHLAYKESSNNPDTFNTIGYIGKYQFGKSALKEVGLIISIQSFKTNPSIFPEELQDTAVIRLLHINKKRLVKVIENYSGKYHNGIIISEAGILAAAHLAGAYGVKRYFDNSINFSDKYGTTIEKYLKEFSNFDLNLKV